MKVNEMKTHSWPLIQKKKKKKIKLKASTPTPTPFNVNYNKIKPQNIWSIQ